MRFLVDKNITKAAQKAIDSLYTCVFDPEDAMTIDNFASANLEEGSAQSAIADMSVMLERRGVTKQVQDFQNIYQFFEKHWGTRENYVQDDNFVARVNNFKCVSILLQYKVQVQQMLDALESLDAITTEEYNEIQQNRFIAELSTNFKVSAATTILDGVQEAVQMLTPQMCQVLGTLKRAHLVVASLRDNNLKGDHFFPAYRTAMTMAATDESSKERLDQLMKVRELIEPWLEQPMSFNDISSGLLNLIQNKEDVINASNSEAAKDCEALVLIRQIDNVCRSWEHTLTYLNRSGGDVSASAAARLLKDVTHYINTGEYWGRLPEFGTSKGSIMLKYKIEDEGNDHPSEWLELGPEHLLESIRFAALSIASIPDDASNSRLAMINFKKSYAMALRLFHSYHEPLQRHG